MKKKIEKQSNPKRWIYYKGNRTLKRLGFNKPSSVSENGEKCSWKYEKWCNEIIEEKRDIVYTTKDHITVQSAF